MFKVMACCLFVVLGFAGRLHGQGSGHEANVRNYIAQYKMLAVAEQQRSGIPAAITLAQGIHETSAGKSELATQANNHFGIKCKKEWTGETFAHTDDAPNECFRKYPSSDHSYKDHTDYLVKSARYAELFKLSITDYAAWAIGLKRCGYATNPRYAQVLIKLIEDYRLQEYTYAGLNNTDFSNKYVSANAEVIPQHDAPITPAMPVTPAVAVTKPIIAPKPGITELPQAPTTSAYGQIAKHNGLKAIYGRKGDTPLEYAYKADIRYAKLLEINEIDERPLPADMYLYLEKKPAKGTRPMHMVKPGETLFSIAQEEAIQVKSLMAMNLLQAGEEPVPGSVLELQRTTTAKPVIVKKAQPANPVLATTLDKPATQIKDTSRPLSVRQTTNPNIRINENSLPVKANNVPAANARTIDMPANTNAKPSEPSVPVIQKATDPMQEEEGKGIVKPVPDTLTRNGKSTTKSQSIVSGQPVMPAAVQANKPRDISTSNVAAIPKPLPAATTRPVAVPLKDSLKQDRPQLKIAKADTQKKASLPVKPVAASAKIVAVEDKEAVKQRTPQVTNPAGKATDKAPAALVTAKLPITAPLKTTATTTPNTLAAKEPAVIATVTQPPVVTVPVKAAPVPEKDPVKVEPLQAKPVLVVASIKQGVKTQPVPAMPEPEIEPKDELDRLKKQFDKVVYARGKTNTSTIQTPKVEPAAAVTEVKTEPKLKASADASKYYTVKKGDTGFSIARENNISIKQLMEWNGLDFGTIQEGQKLRVKP